MTLIAWLVLFEFIVGFFLLVWLIRKAVKHAKHSPAEIALQQHLVELEAKKAQIAQKLPEREKTAQPKKGSKK